MMAQAINQTTLDITELFNNPVRSGIQRVVRELLRHWPGDAPPVCVKFEAGRGLLRLPDAAFRILTDATPEYRAMPWSELRSCLQSFQLEWFDQPPDSLIFIPEVFFDSARCRFYEERLAASPGSVAMLLYDFLAYFNAAAFNQPSLLPVMPYARLSRLAPHTAFISRQTRTQYATRIRHLKGWSEDHADSIGPVLPLGSDGLAIERQHWLPDRRSFVSIGSIDGRKNQHQIAAAFMQLWDAGHDMPLVLIGSAFDRQALDWLDAARRYRHFQWLDAATDDTVAAMLQQARATIYVSDAEGFGLPPVESLAAGIPVIASARLPSLESLPPGGQVRLSEITPDAIKTAVLRFGDDAFAAAAWAEAAEQRLPTWRDFGDHTARWCADIMSRGGMSSARREVGSFSSERATGPSPG